MRILEEYKVVVVVEDVAGETEFSYEMRIKSLQEEKDNEEIEV